MSAFLHSPIAWAALALAAIPIIIHLINRQRLRRLDWAAMEFLLAALKRTRRRIRLEQLLLLLCRVVLMALIALFLARPLLSDRGLGWLAGALRSEDKVFILDDSLSMGRIDLDRSCFDNAKAAVVRELESIAGEGGRDRVTLILGSRPDAPLCRGAFVDRDRVAQLEQALASTTTTSAAMKLAEALESVADMSAATGEAARPRAVSVVTDLRASDWTDGRDKANAAVEKALRRLQESAENPARIVVFDVGTEDTANLAIAGVTVEGGRPTISIPADIRVDVRNYGRIAARDLRLKLSYGLVRDRADQPGSPASTALAPAISEIRAGESFVAGLSPAFVSPGQYWASVELSGARDPLQADNRFYFTVDVVEKTEVLLVNGEPSAERFAGETDYLAFALNPPGEMATGVDPVVVTAESLPRGDLSGFGAVFLANVDSLPDEFRQRLHRYAEQGGSVVILLGDNVRPGVYSRELGEPAPGAARGVLPARISEPAAGEPREVQLLPAYAHPYFRLLKDRGLEELLKSVGFRRYFQLEPLVGSQVLARFDDGQPGGGSPALVEAAVGTGRSLVFASSADSEWHDWPSNSSYLIVFQEILKSIGHSHSREPEVLAGAGVKVPVDVAVHAPRVKVRPTEFPRTPEGEIIARAVESGAAGSTAEFSLELSPRETLQAGHVLLGFLPRGGSAPAAGGGARWRAIAVRPDPRDSDPRRVDTALLKAIYAGVDLEVVADAVRFSEAGKGRFEAADVLMAAFVALAFVEALLALRFARHQHRGGEAAGGRAVVSREGASP